MNIAGPDAEEIVAAAHPGFIILVGKNVVAPAGHRFRQQQTHRLHPLPRFPTHHEVYFSGHSLSPIPSLRSTSFPHFIIAVQYHVIVRVNSI